MERVPSSVQGYWLMYIGPAGFAGGDTVVGVKLDEKRSTSDCDGLYKGERYFRCQPGHGIYQAVEEVELVPPEMADEDVRQLAMSPAPDAETFNLEMELEQLIGLRDVKESIRHSRNYIEVQRRRSAVTGDQSARPLHFAFMQGTPGSGAGKVAQVLGGMLLKFGVLSSGHVVEATRKDLVAGCTGGGDVETKIKKIAKAAEGGVLLVVGADALKDTEKSSDRIGEEALQALTKLLEGASATVEWPQRLCIVVAGRRNQLTQLLETPGVGPCIFAKFEFSDLTAAEVGLSVKKPVVSAAVTMLMEFAALTLAILVALCVVVLCVQDQETRRRSQSSDAASPDVEEEADVRYMHRFFLRRDGYPKVSEGPQDLREVVVDSAWTEPAGQPSTCIICLEPVNSEQPVRRLRCNHQFHPDCILQWCLKRRALECPTCRDQEPLAESKKRLAAKVISSGCQNLTAEAVLV
ncbi:Protein CfxQ [Symbiodinium microadriaticum]|uniref:Protein CfxQ n=1 Tax=Symbiodinium microadriaticum TaxID=2951 RepID=A0A1Q9DV10_SYMMI|nr:Protein CfxQ [Symbiodinium microadriaticum]